MTSSGQGQEREHSGQEAGQAGDPVRLDPYSPPSNYQFEQELRGPPPREIPDALRHGPVRQRRRTAIAWQLVFAVVFLLLSQLSIFDKLATYILPFGYLLWIGLGLVGTALLTFASGFVTSAPFRYVIEGLPLVVRIVELVKAPTLTVNGQDTRHGFVATIQLHHPETSETCLVDVRSPDFSTEAKDAYQTSYKVGDYATAVYLPRDFAKTIQLYGFLGLHSDLGVVHRQEAATARNAVWQIPLVVVILFSFFGALGWSIYAFGRYSPLVFDLAAVWLPMTISAALLAIASIAGTLVAHRREQHRVAEKNLQALSRGEAIEVGGSTFWGPTTLGGWALRVVLAAGTLLLGAAIGYSACISANALFDDSEPQFKPVRILEATMTTHTFVLREFTLEYAFLDSDEEHKLSTSPEHLMLFETDLGLAEIHSGWMSWPWVKTVHPVVAQELGPEEAGQDEELDNDGE